MEYLENILDEAAQELDTLDQSRERAINLTRQLNRVSGRGIAKIVQHLDINEYLQSAREIAKELIEIMNEISFEFGWRLTSSGLEEYLEFEILHSITNSTEIKSPRSQGIPFSIWITALGDVPGELRRLTLGALIEKDLLNAKKFLDNMKSIYQMLAGFDYSKTLVRNLRNKIDSARMVIERTESDFVHAMYSMNNERG